MAENQLLEIATDTMINLYNLDETEYAMFKFSEGAKNVQIGMTNGEVPLVATFPREFLHWQEMQKWTPSKKEDYIRHHLMNGMEIPELVQTNWSEIIEYVMTTPNKMRQLSPEELTVLEEADGIPAPVEDAILEEEAESELNTPIEEELSVDAVDAMDEVIEEEKAKVIKPKKKVAKKKK